MRYLLIITFLCFLSIVSISAQSTFSIKGTVIHKTNRQPLDYVSVQLDGFAIGAVTDSLGQFEIDRVKPGIYKLKVSSLGYKTQLTPEYIVSNKNLNITIEMEESAAELQGVTITASAFRKMVESPSGLRIIGLQEIEKSPGANRDISRIVQLYPGVAFSPAGYRNDLIVRGGAPSENSFFIDGIEIPNINHFSTQGASGGPVGIINADLLREVNFYSGAFPVNRGNALSSVIDMKLRDGSTERHSLKATLGASEVSLSANGPLNEKTTYLFSVRQSYLQFLFDLLGLPFLPTFTDAQFKTKTRFNANNELIVLGIMGIDNMRLNTKVTGESAEYILSYLPKIQQETFTVGALYRHYSGIHVQTLSLSHSYLNNRNTKYRGNDESNHDNLILKLRSIEQQTKLRFENLTTLSNWSINVGASFEMGYFDNNSLQRFNDKFNENFIYRSHLNLLMWSFFGTASYTSPNERFTASMGVRADANNFSQTMNRLSKQVSPRVALSYELGKGFQLVGSSGLYYQRPQATAMGYKDEWGRWANEGLRYVSVWQNSFGMSWNMANRFEVSAEGFYKKYNHVPLSVVDGIPLACKGDDYGVIGNELLLPTAQGRSYGVEVLGRWIMPGRLNLSTSFTLFRSEYRNSSTDPYIASAWDNRYIVNLSGTYNFPRNWSVGAKVSCIGGSPFTPYDVERSSMVNAWDAQGRPYYDYTQYNMGRGKAFGQLDVRVDKSFYFKRSMLGFYIDLQNISKSIYQSPDVLLSTGVIANPDAPQSEQRYQMKYVEQKSGTILPTLGITFEY